MDNFGDFGPKIQTFGGDSRPLEIFYSKNFGIIGLSVVKIMGLDPQTSAQSDEPYWAMNKSGCALVNLFLSLLA